MRTPFQRDRDRIIHATAFRRLTYKTQVFVFHEGDHYRTRLTHSLEVAQIARAIARMLGLDEDLAEALALAHDLGHPPFGHAGERALAEVMAPYGGFDHNAQSLKVVTKLERKYARFDGLNLTLETLEGLVKHNGPLTGEGHGAAPLWEAIAAAGLAGRLHDDAYAPAEAQAAAALVAAESVDPPPALLLLTRGFGLSRFEQEALLLCTALELDSQVAALCAYAQGDPARPYPTFALIAALFDEPTWDLLSPERPLRYWRLIEINQPGAEPLTTKPSARSDSSRVCAASVKSSAENCAANPATAGSA